jgi:two-component system, cell cycle sensor histidine kinase and response regulator CckA
MHRQLASPTVLIAAAQDDARNARIRALEGQSFRTEHVADGAAALAAVRRDLPDLIISDVTLPGMDAVALCNALRREPAARHTPILLIDSRPARAAAIAAALDAGANDYLLEPIEPALLVAKARALLVPPALHAELARVNVELAARAEGDAQLRAAFDNALDSMLIVDDEGRYVDANPSACRLLGVAKDQLIGRNAGEFVGDAVDFAALWKDFLHNGSRDGEVVLRRGDGDPFDAEFVARAHIVPGRHLAIVRDLSERRRLEEHVREVQRLEAVGRLAGGIAHDFNNLLTIILGAAELLTEELPRNGFAWHQAVETQAAAKRAASLTSQLLAFSRRQLLRPTRVHLGDLVRDLQPTLHQLVGDRIAIALTMPDGLPQVRVDASQFGQVIVDLVANARDAMPSGGTLTIETKRVHLDAEYAARHVGVTPGPYVMLAMSDTGAGIDAITQKRIFEPFFTTKELGKGTGLGLSTVYGIVKQSGGNIWVYSEPGRGTTFKVYVPEAPGVAPHPPGRGREQLVRGEGHLLLVEDEPGVRAIASQILQRCGYRVTVASDGPDALLKCERTGLQFDLVITDVVMPGMTGTELVKRLEAQRPGLRILYTSGYTEDGIIHHGVAAGAHFLAKPFTPSDLARKVREVLEAPLSNVPAAEEQGSRRKARGSR